MKFDDFVEGVPFNYGDVFRHVTYADGTKSLMIGVSRGQIAVLRDLAEVMSPPYRILYVANELSQDIEPGRYEFDGKFGRDQLGEFLAKYGVMFEEDGRHALWLTSDDGTVVFTQHDVIYAYGPIEEYDRRLRRRDFSERDFSIPGPHFHFYDGNYDGLVEELLNGHAWTFSPLQDMDEET